ncbi:MAG: ComEC/Rec2 family competence protein [Candidatus Dormibacteraeota bacterium]|nr:ComEC/Rec2 family competence protein [Candidatus Dormibacteraeota bacterium]MBV9525006.1 ComEC/Rec2 family competence protein [Candidatus Dormibacteraeota bacterium]
MSRLAGTLAGRWTAVACSALAAGCALGFASGLPVGVVELLLAALGAATAAAVMAAARKGRVALVLVAAAAALLGLARGADAAAPRQDRVGSHTGSGPVALTGTVRSTLTGSSGVIVDAERLAAPDWDGAVTGGVLVTGAALPAVSPGDRVEVDAALLRAPSGRPGPQSEATLERQDVTVEAASAQMSVLGQGGPSLPRLVAGVQTRLTATVNALLPEPAAPLVLGIAFGIHQPLAADVHAPLQQAGLIHIVVVSGLKVVMLLGLVAALGDVLAWSPRRKLAAALLSAGFYVVLSGAGPAAIRSALMAGTAMFARSHGRRVDPLPLLALVAAVMLVADPAAALDAGFQLSFVGTAGILVLAGPLARRIPGPRLFSEPFAVTLAAQLATAPVMAGTFGVLSVVGPLANALVLPALPALIVVGGAGAVLGAVAPPLGWLPLQLAGLGADAVVLLSRALTAVPASSVQISQWPPAWTAALLAGAGSLILIVITARRWSAPGAATPRRGAALGAAGALAVTGLVACGLSRAEGKMRATVLDTGSAPAVLVQTADGSEALVDGGSSPASLVQALGRVLPPFTRRIGLVVLTDPGQRAAAGLAGLSGHYDVGTVVVAGDLTPGATAVVSGLQQQGAEVLASAGRSWRWGGDAWRCLTYRSATTGSAACAVEVGDPTGRLLVLGNAGTADQDDLAAMYGRALAADVVVAPPGGALSPALLIQAAPNDVAIPLARGSPAAPAALSVHELRTGSDGDLAFEGGEGGLSEVT